eukprot:g18296.t1
MAQNNERAGRSVRDDWLVSVAKPLCREMIEHYWQQHGRPMSGREEFSVLFNEFLAAFPVRAEEEAKTRRRTLLEENRIPDGPALLIEELAGTCVEFAPVMPAAVLGIPMETAREFWWNTQKKTPWWLDGVRMVAEFVRKNASAGKRRVFVSTGGGINFCPRPNTGWANNNDVRFSAETFARRRGAGALRVGMNGATETVSEVLWLTDWAMNRAPPLLGSLFVAGLECEHRYDGTSWHTLVEMLLFHEFKKKAGYKLEAMHDKKTTKIDYDSGLDLDLVLEPVSDVPSSRFSDSASNWMLSW